VGTKSLLIDVGPDFRQQALRAKISHLDGLLLTHTHYDHIAGIDDFRALNFFQNTPIPCLLSKESFAELETRYHYLFKAHVEGQSHAAKIDCRILADVTGVVEFAGLQIGYTTYWQGDMKVNGFRIGDFAYISDIRTYGEEIFSFLDGVQYLVVSALRIEPSHVHFSLEEAASFAHKVKAKKTWLTHLSHHVDYETASQILPADVRPGFDGFEFTFEV
jgi:phosphoribosyl 1,2-cyclic phosphate phosphodiesterase